MTTTEKIAAIRETLAGALEAESDFRRIGATNYAREMALMATTCREYCEDHASDGVGASDLAYIYQTIRPDSDTGAAQDPADAMFWRLTYRRMIGATTPLRGLDLSTVNIPEACHPTEG